MASEAYGILTILFTLREQCSDRGRLSDQSTVFESPATVLCR